ncbi:hypothetical protein [Bradyrhizobium genomosp. III]|uniref:hypothetical protein n=1 Tax=Bradyrhizobium genomosp. III TaxID=2683271 RepID=UPI001F0AE167|nr:hypothetical protein [Bradyrhizobium sp. CCBAU 15635]
MSFIACGLGAGAAGAGAGFAASAGGGLASSSAMMRRIEARISSIEGSVTFAGCVISDSTSSTPSHALFYTKHDRIGRFRMGGPTFSSWQPDLSPDHGSTCSGAPLPPALKLYAYGITARRIDPHRLGKAMSGILVIASKAPVGLGNSRGRPDEYGNQRPSGVRTPAQLSRT